jgi:hypothetical protein
VLAGVAGIAPIQSAATTTIRKCTSTLVAVSVDHGPTDSVAGDLRNEPKEAKRAYVQLLSSLLLDLANMRELRAWLNELIDARALKLGKRHARWSPLAHSKRGAPKGALYPPGRADGC